MKKFLAVLLSIIVVVALGFTVFYLVRDNEEIYLSTSSIYVAKGDTFDIDINFKNKKSYTDYEIIIDKSNVVKYNEESENFTALAGGYTKVLFRTSNVNYRNLDCVVYVGDGNATSPFYVTTAEQIVEIGKADADGNVKFPLDAHYSLRNNVALSDAAAATLGYWNPIGYDASTGEVTPFTGELDGRGYTISNMNLNKDAFNSEVDEGQLQLTKQNYEYAGLFAKLGANAVVKNIKFENATITGAYQYAGVVAGVSESADIERIEVKSAIFDVKNTEVAGGVAGKIEATVTSQSYTSSSVDRVSANITVNNISKVFGGLVGENFGGYVVYSYATGNVKLYNEYSNVVYGGIVGRNKTVFSEIESRTVYSGASVKDTYTSVVLSYELPEGAVANVDSIKAGMIIGENITNSTTKQNAKGETVTKYNNKVMGNYYNVDIANILVDGATKTYTGVASSTNLSGTAIADIYADQEYVVLGVTAEDMTKTETYLSHVSSGDIILWKFGTVWIEVEGSMPILDYADQAVSPEIEGIEDAEEATDIDRFLELLNDPETTSIVIGSDLDFSGRVWEVKSMNIKLYADYDETKTGPNGEKVYYKLLNLNTSNSLNNNPLEYAALFSTIGKDAELHNITIDGAKFENGIYSAGFAYDNQGKIYDCSIINSSIIGKKEAAGIAINNSGEIAKSYKLTVDENGAEVHVYGNGVLVQNVNVVVKITETAETVLSGNVKASGITNLNAGNITGVVVKGLTENYAIKIVSTGTAANAELAGVAVQNIGTITNVNVSFVAGSAGIKAEGTFGAVAAGLAVHNSSSINNSYVSANIYTYNGNSNTAAAGLVANITGDATIEKCGFYGNNKSIQGYKAAGVSIQLSQSKLRKIALNGWDAFWGTAVITTSKAEMGDGIKQCYVAGSTSIIGHDVAGLVVSISNGAVLDSYVGTGVVLKGVDTGSKVASFAINVSCNQNNKQNGNFSTGIIAYCYSDASFDNPGTSYGVAGDNIMEAATNEGKKGCGYGVSLIVSKSKTSGAKFYDEGFLYPASWDGNGQGDCKTSDGDMHTTNGSDNKFRGFNFASDIWSFDTNQLGGDKSGVGPTLSQVIVDTDLLLVD